MSCARNPELSGSVSCFGCPKSLAAAARAFPRASSPARILVAASPRLLLLLLLLLRVLHTKAHVKSLRGPQVAVPIVECDDMKSKKKIALKRGCARREGKCPAKQPPSGWCRCSCGDRCVSVLKRHKSSATPNVGSLMQNTVGNNTNQGTSLMKFALCRTKMLESQLRTDISTIFLLQN
jgi:hypothetical protein